MDDLIERLEKATEGSCELDADIEQALGTARYIDREEMWAAAGDQNVWSIPDYTSSLDAALTLVSAGKAWTVSNMLARGNYWASVADPNNHDDMGYPANAKSAALALCIAALRALQSTPKG